MAKSWFFSSLLLKFHKKVLPQKILRNWNFIKFSIYYYLYINPLFLQKSSYRYENLSKWCFLCIFLKFLKKNGFWPCFPFLCPLTAKFDEILWKLLIFSHSDAKKLFFRIFGKIIFSPNFFTVFYLENKGSIIFIAF